MEFETYIAGYKKRLAEMHGERERHRQRVLERVRGLSPLFDRLPGVRRVYAFGSSVRQGGFTPESDVDLAFEGLPPERLCETLSALVECLETSVDAVRLEDAKEPLREEILKGVVVYERRPSTDP
jgi:predicted nucleotidyltransferase